MEYPTADARQEAQERATSTRVCLTIYAAECIFSVVHDCAACIRCSNCSSYRPAWLPLYLCIPEPWTFYVNSAFNIFPKTCSRVRAEEHARAV
jgi:hypothetical protein